MAAEELIEVKFRLADGTDIGPGKYSSISTVGSLKEKIISQWPKGYLFLEIFYFILLIFVYICIFLVGSLLYN